MLTPVFVAFFYVLLFCHLDAEHNWGTFLRKDWNKHAIQLFCWIGAFKNELEIQVFYQWHPQRTAGPLSSRNPSHEDKLKNYTPLLWSKALQELQGYRQAFWSIHFSILGNISCAEFLCTHKIFWIWTSMHMMLQEYYFCFIAAFSFISNTKGNPS